MAKSLYKNGHQAVVLIGGDGPIIEHFRNAGIVTEVIPNLCRDIEPLNDVRAYINIKDVLERYRPNLVSTHSSKAGFLGRIAARRLNIPALFTAHGWSFTSGKRIHHRIIYKTLERLVLPITDKIITVSNYDKNLALTSFGLSDKKVITIHNGIVDSDRTKNRVQQDSGLVHIIKVARFDSQKNHLELLDAVKNIKGIHLHFVGDGPLMNIVKKRVTDFNLTDYTTFWGRLENVSEVLSASQIFILISNWEGFPRSTLEAMRHSLPVIVSDVGGAAEAVDHNVTGYVVKKGDVQSLKNHIIELVQNPEKRIDMGMMAREKYVEQFTFDRMYDDTLAVYDEVLEKSRGEFK